MPPAKSIKASPRKSNVRRVPFSVKAEGARAVVLTGDFTQWATDKLQLSPASNGEWTTTLELAPGEYQYRLIVDGQWRDHDGSTPRVPNPFGGYNSILKVS